MRKIIVAEFITVNGLIPDPGNTTNWVKDSLNDEMLREISNQQSHVDTLLLGRLTYQFMMQYWANASPETEDEKIIRYMNNTPKMVFNGIIRPW